MDRRGRGMWYAYAACVISFLVAAPLYGPVAVVAGVIGTAFGLERVVATWGSIRRAWTIAFLIWIGMGAVAMLLPVWGHDSVVDENGITVIKRHDHFLWERDLIH